LKEIDCIFNLTATKKSLVCTAPPYIDIWIRHGEEGAYAPSPYPCGRDMFKQSIHVSKLFFKIEKFRTVCPISESTRYATSSHAMSFNLVSFPFSPAHWLAIFVSQLFVMKFLLSSNYNLTLRETYQRAGCSLKTFSSFYRIALWLSQQPRPLKPRWLFPSCGGEQLPYHPLQTTVITTYYNH